MGSVTVQNVDCDVIMDCDLIITLPPPPLLIFVKLKKVNGLEVNLVYYPMN